MRFSKTGLTIYYAGRTFQRLGGAGFKANYFDLESGGEFWISGPRRDGADGLYGRVTQPADVDPDIFESYWRDIRGMAPPGSASPVPKAWEPVEPTDPQVLHHGPATVWTGD